MGNSSSFPIPQHLRYTVLTVSRGERTLCNYVLAIDCTSKCPCPGNGTDHEAIISNDNIVFSNLNLSNNIDTLKLYFVKIDNGCNKMCNLRSTIEIYEVIIRGTLYMYAFFIVTTCDIIVTLYPTGPPGSPMITYNDTNSEICFNSLFNPDYPVERYEVNITDSLGALTLSDSYDTARCLSITSDKCGSFSVSVAANNSFGYSDTSTFPYTRTGK